MQRVAGRRCRQPSPRAIRSATPAERGREKEREREPHTASSQATGSAFSLSSSPNPQSALDHSNTHTSSPGFLPALHRACLPLSSSVPSRTHRASPVALCTAPRPPVSLRLFLSHIFSDPPRSLSGTHQLSLNGKHHTPADHLFTTDSVIQHLTCSLRALIATDPNRPGTISTRHTLVHLKKRKTIIFPWRGSLRSPASAAKLL